MNLVEFLVSNSKTIPEDLTETEKEVARVLMDRWNKGRERYGEGLDWSQTNVDAWLWRAIEEAADLLQYLVSLRLKLYKESHRPRRIPDENDK